MRVVLIAVTAILLQGCSLFGRTTVTHDEMVLIPLPEAPKLDPNDAWQVNFTKVATYGVRLTRGVQVYNEYALQHNLEFGYVTPEEEAEVRQRYRIPSAEPAE